MLFQLLKKENPKALKHIFYMAVVSGIANGCLIGIINQGSNAVSNKDASGTFLLLFAIAMAIFIIAKRWTLMHSTELIENIVRGVRVRFGDKIRRSELQIVENLGKGEVFTKVAQETSQISQSAILIANACQESIMLVFCLFYIFYLDKPAFFITVISIGIAVYIYSIHEKSIVAEMKTLAKKEGRLLDSLSHIIDGFKEIRMNTHKSNDLFTDFKDKAVDSEISKTKISVKFATDIMFSHVFFYTLICIIIFILPQFIHNGEGKVIKLTAALLFIIGPLEMIVAAVPVFMRSNIALKNLQDLEDTLDLHLPEEENFGTSDQNLFVGFKTIQFKSYAFSYIAPNGAPSFTVGPFDLEIKRGETIFFVGGNGSGKSTVMKLLTGLYPKSTGFLKLEQTEITTSNRNAFRNLFACVFTDFHLFDRFYGIDNVDAEYANKLISDMDLKDKTRFENGRFTSINLSTGQKKRLALIIAIMEDKQIYVFDEWAADQDPHFRKHFYEVILKDLKAKGKTILAVTHDDKYFGHADRLIKLNYGEMEEIKEKTTFLV